MFFKVVGVIFMCMVDKPVPFCFVPSILFHRVHGEEHGREAIFFIKAGIEGSSSKTLVDI